MKMIQKLFVFIILLEFSTNYQPSNFFFFPLFFQNNIYLFYYIALGSPAPHYGMEITVEEIEHMTEIKKETEEVLKDIVKKLNSLDEVCFILKSELFYYL